MSPLFFKIRYFSILFSIHYSIYGVNESVHVSYVPLLSSTGNEGVCLFTGIRRSMRANSHRKRKQKPISQKAFTIMAPFTQQYCELVFMITLCEFILVSNSPRTLRPELVVYSSLSILNQILSLVDPWHSQHRLLKHVL